MASFYAFNRDKQAAVRVVIVLNYFDFPQFPKANLSLEFDIRYESFI